MRFVLTPEQAQQLVDYLAGRPYREVVDLIQVLVASQEEEPEDKEK